MPSPINANANGIVLTLHVQPSAAVTEACGIHGDALKLRLAARAVEGEANKELVRFLSEFLGVPRSSVAIAHGQTGRRKLVVVSGEPGELLERARALLASQ